MKLLISALMVVFMAGQAMASVTKTYKGQVYYKVIRTDTGEAIEQKAIGAPIYLFVLPTNGLQPVSFSNGHGSAPEIAPGCVLAVDAIKQQGSVTTIKMIDNACDSLELPSYLNSGFLTFDQNKAFFEQVLGKVVYGPIVGNSDGTGQAAYTARTYLQAEFTLINQ